MTEPAMATDLRSVAPLLPLQLDSESGTLVWPVGVSLALSVLARGPSASGVLSGEALLDNIVELRHRSGMVDSGLSSKAMHGLMIFFGELVSEDFAHSFFHSTVPSIAKLALKLSSLLKEHVEHARRMRNHSLSQPNKDLHLRILPAQQEGLVLISQELASSVLACAFFCLYPSAERQRMDLPGINFDQLFMSIYEKGGSQAHKLMCILHYFERVCQSMPQGMISYERKVLRLDEMEGSAHCPDAAFWSSSSLPLCQLVVLEDGTIEGNETTALEVDFANKYLGGGALHSGCVQEEIRFMINPELIAGMLFLPGMADNEAIEIVGTERFSQYEGYGSSFRFAGDYSDKKPRDSWGRLATHIVAIDALPRPGKDQFELSLMLRELNKAFCGFLDQHSKPQTTLGVATGNWGCGVFGGDHELKSVLQWLAASEAGRPFLLYYSFNDQRTKKLQKVANWILQEGWCVWDLWSVLMEYGRQRKQLKVGFFDWILPGG